MRQAIQAFLAGKVFAVAGASGNRDKFGNKVLRCYQQHGLAVHPVNPKEKTIEGVACYADVASLPKAAPGGPVHGLSIVTPPAVTEQVVEDAAKAGIRHLWIQPGAESPKAIARAQELGLVCVSGGPCLLVELGYRD